MQYCIHLLLLLCSTSSVLTERDPSHLTKWASRNGIQFSRVDVLPSPNDPTQYSLRTTGTIEIGESIIIVPRKLIWSAQDSPDHDPVQRAINRQSLKVQEALRANGQCMMAVRLLHERSLGSDSMWHAYVDSLPRSSRLSVLIRDELLDIANNIVFAKNARKHRSTLKVIYEVLILPEGVFASLSPTPPPTFQEFVNAWSVVASRSFGVESVATMVPLSDFANHNHSACDIAETLETDTGDMRGSSYHENLRMSDFVVKATRAYKKGEDLHVCYHRHAANSMLLSNWGFTMDNNSRDYVLIEAISPGWDENNQNQIMIDLTRGGAIAEKKRRIKIIMRLLKLTNTCMFLSSESPLKRVLTTALQTVVDGCHLTIGLNMLEPEVLQDSMRQIRGCELETVEKEMPSKKSFTCNVEELRKFLEREVDARVKKTDMAAVFIGKLLRAEVDVMKPPPTQYARKILARTINRSKRRRRGGGGGGGGAGGAGGEGGEEKDDAEEEEDKEERDVVNLLRIRHGMLRVIRQSLVEQVIKFAQAQGLDRDVEQAEAEKLVQICRLKFQKERKISSTTGDGTDLSIEVASRHYDEISGYFYYSDDTGKTWWDPDKWRMNVDPGTGKLFYSSEILDTTSWELPSINVH